MNAYVRDHLRRVNVDGYTRDDYERGLKTQLDAARRRGDPDADLRALLDTLCLQYPQLGDSDRAEIRRLVASHASLPDRVEGYAVSTVRRLGGEDDAMLLQRALAAMSIADCARDFRDTLNALAEIWVATEHVRIDPQPWFEWAARLSGTTRPEGGEVPLAETLAGFHSYAVLAARRERDSSVPSPE